MSRVAIRQFHQSLEIAWSSLQADLKGTEVINPRAERDRLGSTKRQQEGGGGNSSREKGGRRWLIRLNCLRPLSLGTQPRRPGEDDLMGRGPLRLQGAKVRFTWSATRVILQGR